MPSRLLTGCSEVDAPAAVTTVSALESLGVLISDNCTPDSLLIVTSSDSHSGSCPVIVTRTYRVTDACNNYSEVTQTIYVADTTAPVITGIIPESTVEGCSEVDAPAAVTTVSALESLGVLVSDNCTPDSLLIVTSSDSHSGSCPVIVTRTYRVTDACNNYSEVTQTIYVADTTAPVITGIIPESTVEGCSEVDAPAAVTTVSALESLGVLVSDNCTPDSLLIVTSSDSHSGSCPVIVTRTYRVTDACNNYSEVTQTIYVDDTTAPVITGIIPESTVEGCSEVDAPAAVTTVSALESLGVLISDNCTPDSLLIVTSSDSHSGSCPVIVTRTYRVTDACNNYSEVTQTIYVADTTAPVITGIIPESTVEGCSEVDAPAAVTTVSALESLGVLISDNCTPDSLLIVTSSDSHSGSCPVIVTRTYRVTDACNNYSEVTQTIYVDDTTAPVITGIIPESTVEGCSEVDAPAAVTTVSALESLGVLVSDNCTPDSLLIVTSSDSHSGSCPVIVTRTYRVTDACNNYSEVTQTIYVDDTTAPVITGIIPESTVEGCSEVDAPAAVTTVSALESLGVLISDNCTPDSLLIVTSSDSHSGSCPVIVTRTYRVTDACNNYSEVTQTIYVDDTTAPVITGIIPESTVEGCSEVDAPAAVTTVSALESLGVLVSDNCTPDSLLIVTSSDSHSGSCPVIVTRTYRVTDACNNYSEVTQTIYVDDTTAPVITGIIPESTVEGCSEVDAPAAVTTVSALESLGVLISDNCTPDSLLIVTSSDSHSGSCPVIVTRTYRVTDACNNYSEVTQTIYVADTTAPVITGIIPESTVEGCSEVDAPAAVTTVSALESLGVLVSDNCTPDSLLIVTSSDSHSGSCPVIVTRTYRVTDACNNYSEVTQTIYVDDTTAPVITGIIPESTVEGCSEVDAPAAVTTVSALESLGVLVSDNCTPDSLLIVTSSDSHSGSCPVVVTRTYRVTDACGNYSEVTQTINVSDTIKPVITGILADTTVTGCTSGDAPAAVATVSALESLGVLVSDNCTPDSLLIVTSSDSHSGSCPVVVTRTYRVTDACGNYSEVTQTINVSDTIKPVITGILADTTVTGCTSGDAPAAVATVSALESLGVLISDNCTPDSLLIVTSSDSHSGSCPVVVTRTYRVTDACGNYSEVTQTINVSDTIKPVITGILADTTVTGCTSGDAPAAVTTVSALESLGVLISDNCTPDSLLIVTSSDSHSGSCPVVVTRTYRVTDACGNYSEVTQTINVSDTIKPVITGILADTTVTGCTSGDAPAAVATVSALESLGVLISDNCTPDSLLIVTSSDSHSGSCPVVVTRTYRVTDACGNYSEVTQTINVSDTIKPVITGILADTTVTGCTSGDAPAAVATVSALESLGVLISDNCTPDSLLIVTSSDSHSGSCPVVVTRTYRVTDACGNYSEVTQTINVSDTIKPVITGILADTTVTGCTSGDAPAAVATVSALESLGVLISDNCTPDSLLIVTSSDSHSGSCPVVVTRTYRVTDACGNYSEVTQTINISDTIKPVITGILADTTVTGCTSGDAPAAVATVSALESLGVLVSDNCTPDSLLIVTSSDSHSGSCPVVVTRTYRVTDACGNYSEVTQTINVSDTIKPVITGIIPESTVEGCSDW
ncbi:MAG: hypothetical protein ACOXZQ_08515 [Bacteroidales bacterium]